MRYVLSSPDREAQQDGVSAAAGLQGQHQQQQQQHKQQRAAAGQYGQQGQQQGGQQPRRQGGAGGREGAAEQEETRRASSNAGGGHEQQQAALQSSMALMRRLLVDAQAKFRNMMDDNKALATRIDGDLHQAHQEVSQLRAELQDTNSRIANMAAAVHIPAPASNTAFLCSGGYAPSSLSNSSEPPSPPAPAPMMSTSCPPSIPHQIGSGFPKSCPRCQDGMPLEDAYRVDGSESKAAVSVQTDEVTTTTFSSSAITNGKSDPDEQDDETVPVDERLQRLQEDKRQLAQHNLNLQKELDELRAVQEKQRLCLREEQERMQAELSSAREALSALKQDRKRLKAEKFDLLNQMKQLYGTLEDKEKELRDFIRNYEQRMHDSDHSLKQLAQEREECDRERWNLLKHARDEAERSVALRAQLGIKEAQVKQLQDQLQQVQDKLTYLSDVESLHGVAGTSNGFQQGGTPSRRSCRSPAVGSEPPVVSLGYDSSPSHRASSGSGAMDSPKKSPMSVASSSSAQQHPAGILSRSAEEIYQSSGSSDTSAPRSGAPGKPKKRRDGRSPWGSISRVFLRARQRKALEPTLYGTTGPESSPQHHHQLQLQQQRQRCSWSPQGGAGGGGPALSAVPPPLLTQEEAAEKLRLLEEAQGTPMERWKAPTVLAWLELALAMPQYGPMCAENVKSGKILLELSDSELEAGLGITNVMHRRKLRLAIEEHREPSICPYPKMCLVTHTWVCGEWLSSLGLSAHADSFRAQLVDGRVLDTLSRRDLDKRLGMTNRHEQTSLLRGVQLLRALRFDLRALAHRRAHCRHLDVDPLVWTNQRFVQWARSIDLGEYSENLRESGVHGALVVLEPSFTADTMAQALGIPVSKNIIRRHLTTELENLVQPARMSLEAEAVVESKRSGGERLSSATGSLGRSFGRSSRARSSERGASSSDKRRSSIRDSLGRVLGFNSLPKPSTSGLGTTYHAPSLVVSRPPPVPRVFRPSTPQPQPRPPQQQQQHRRVFSQGTIETLTVTPV